MQVMKSHERSETIMKTKITVLLAMVMILSLFVSGFVFAGTITYTYDNAGRLISADYGGGKTIAYTYDNNGNLLTRNISVQATQYTITVSPDPAEGEGGTVSGGGTYDKDSQVTVIATAKAGYTFLKWTEGGTEVSSGSTYTFSATRARTLVAHFKYTIYVSSGDCGGLSPCYHSINVAVSRAPDDALIKVAAEIFSGDTTVGPGQILTIFWGYNSNFSAITGATQIEGRFTAKNKTIIRGGTIRAK